MFDTRQLYLLIGSSCSGKTYLLRHILSAFLESKRLKFGLVFTRSVEQYTTWLPQHAVIPSYDDNVLTQYLEALKKFKKKTGEYPPNFVIFDDIMASINQQARGFKSFMCDYRHFNTTVFVLCHHGNQIIPTIKSQTSYAIIFKQHMKKSIEVLYESFGQLYETTKDFTKDLNKYTAEEYQVMIWIASGKNTRATKYAHYKAPADRKQLTFTF
jgi:hypothetical protein